MRPGVDVISRALPPPRSAPTDTGVAFVVGDTGLGDDPYLLVHSMTEYEANLGPRDGGPATYDWADVYFREGGSQLYVARTNPEVDGGTQAAPTGADLEAMTRGDLDAYATGLGLDPTAYSTKADEIAAIEALSPNVLALDPTIQAALDALVKQLGPGQVAIADPVLAADAANQSALTAHARACNRVALLSCADGDATALKAAGVALQSDANGRYGALFAPSAVVPGVVAGTTRTVPYTAVEAGIIARNDLSYTANQAAAGVLGQALYAIDVNGRYTDQEYSDLNVASVNMARIVYGGVRTYGYRACIDATKDPTWEWFGFARLNMEITAQAEEIGERYVFSQLDGKRRTISQFGGELSAMLAPLYDAGALYGDTAADAYDVDVGISVNTEATIANGELHAILSVKMSPAAEWVEIEIVKVATTQSLPATAVAA